MLKQKKMEYESEKGIPFPDLITLSELPNLRYCGNAYSRHWESTALSHAKKLETYFPVNLNR